MTTTTFTNGVTLSDAGWFNDVDALVYDVFNGKSTAGTSGTILRSNGTNIVNSTATYPDTATSAGKILRADGTNWSASTATYPNTATGTGTLLRADGTNWVASTATYPDTTTSGRFLISTGANTVSDSNRITHDGTACTITGTAVWGTGVASYGMVVKRKTADESVTASVALQDDDHLNITVAANEEWLGKFLLFISAPSNFNTHGLKVAITVPAAATMIFSCSSTVTDGTVAYVTASGSALDFSTTETAGTTGVFEFDFWVLNGANAGTIQLQWAESTAANTLTFKKGSYMIAHRVA